MGGSNGRLFEGDDQYVEEVEIVGSEMMKLIRGEMGAEVVK